MFSILMNFINIIISSEHAQNISEQWIGDEKILLVIVFVLKVHSIFLFS
jgi:hypothetical protein